MHAGGGRMTRTFPCCTSTYVEFKKGLLIRGLAGGAPINHETENTSPCTHSCQSLPQLPQCCQLSFRSHEHETGNRTVRVRQTSSGSLNSFCNGLIALSKM
ncbi:hypothetical protein GQ55_9G438000 [Panicum hallii var. hallii]|uniref:Uncharacterized protein n=1 Tax=Panicum hallii var. hallii TaxID=1504633 RepID=A0A2T7CB89_9POAL|nr:hypothetical protein GQ55_9G438000 [Panicum hallii var. hallii]